MNSKGQAWLHALRLRTLPLSLAGIVLGSAIAYMNDYFDGLIFGLAILTTILFQILSNLANDLGDSQKGTDNKDRIGPMRSVQSGLISIKEMQYAVIGTAVLSFLSAAALIAIGTVNMPLEILFVYAILGFLSIAAAIGYTVGKRAYGYHGLGDLMVFIFFGLVSVLGVYSLFAKSFDILVILPGVTIGSLSVAVLNLNNMRDYANDEKSGKRTMVVIMGHDWAKIYHGLLIFAGLICLLIYLLQINKPLLFIALLPAVILILHLQKVMRTSKAQDFDPELKKVALSTFAIAVLFFVGALI